MRVFCPQCNSEYRIKYPSFGPVLIIIDYGDKFINRVCPVVAGGVALGSLYWSAVTYGAITVMQTVGHKNALEMMEKEDPLFLLAFLPVIPFGLILGRMVKWEDYLLQLWRKHSSKLWYMVGLKESDENVDQIARVPVEPGNGMDFIYATRVLCGALMLPTFASAFGNYFFKGIHSAFKRTLLVSYFLCVKNLCTVQYLATEFLLYCCLAYVHIVYISFFQCSFSTLLNHDPSLQNCIFFLYFLGYVVLIVSVVLPFISVHQREHTCFTEFVLILGWIGLCCCEGCHSHVF